MAELAVGATELIQQRLFKGVRIALLMVAVVVQFGLGFAPGVQHDSHSIRSWPEVLAFLLLTSVALGGAYFVVRQQPLPAVMRSGGVTALLLSSALVSLALPLDPLIRAEHWSFGLIGWYALFLLFDGSLAAITALLGTHVVLSMGVVVSVGAPSVELASMAIAAVSVTGYQFGLGMAAGIVRRIALSVAEASRAEESVRIREVTAELTHRDREQHYARLLETTAPLLAGLATGALDPAAEETRRRCAIEAARMRRMFAESDDNPDRLVHELRAAIDVAERNGVSVQLAVRGEPYELTVEVRRELLEPISEVLAAVRANARVTVLRGPESVRVSVIGEVTVAPSSVAEPRHVRMAKVLDGRSLWMETRWEAGA